MRHLILIAALALCPTFAMADESVSRQWRADMGHGVLISMDVLADGHWLSETVQNNNVVAQMAGTYTQNRTNDTSGTLVFTPVQSNTGSAHGPARIETDKYSLGSGGEVLKLVTGNETMVFHKQPAS